MDSVDNVVKLELLFELNLQFFAKDGEGGEKTEEPTSKKLDDARKEGQVCRSKEINSALMLLSLFLILRVYTSSLGSNFLGVFSEIYAKIPDAVSYKDASSVMMVDFMNEAVKKMLIMVLPFFLVGVVISVVADVLQVKWKVTTKPLQPKLSKFNPINGFKRIFSKDSLFELLKSIIKIVVIFLVAYNMLKKNYKEIFILYNIDIRAAIAEIGSIVINVGFTISLVYCIIGAIDYIYQRYKFKEDMKMTKQEVKDEMKNSEGDPQIKGKQRQRMQEASRRRMMQDVPKADVVITNPTHFAVALKYDKSYLPEPYVVAKGADLVAKRIKEIAKENDVVVIENKPLARALYATVEIGKSIPPELFTAVADILVEVHKLTGKEWD